MKRRNILTAFCGVLLAAGAALAAAPTAKIRIDIPEQWKTGPNAAKVRNYFPDIGITLTEGYAPFAVFFEGWQSANREELVRYDWDFGPGTETDELGRTFEGFNAAHVFEKEGTYRVTLTVKNAAGQTATDTVTITVKPRTASMKTYYVDSSAGDDAADGLSPTADGGHGPWKTANKAFGKLVKAGTVYDLKPGDRVLFNRGQAFLLRGEITDNTASGGLFTVGHGMAGQGIQYGAYGKAGLSKPKIVWQGTGFPADVINSPNPTSAPLYNFGWGLCELVVSDLEFDFWDSAHHTQLLSIMSAAGGIHSILFLRDDFHDMCGGLFEIGEMDPKPWGVFVVSCSVNNHLSALWAGTQMFGGPGRLAIMNGKFDESGNHIAYLGGVDKGVISKNVFSRPAFGRTALRITGGTGANLGNNIEISDNLFLGWTDPLVGGNGRGGGSHNGEGKRMNFDLINLCSNSLEEYLEYIVFERNVVTNFEVAMTVANLWYGTIRNNIFVTPIAGRALEMNAGLGLFRPLKNVYVYGNTFCSGSLSISYPIVRITPYETIPGGGTTFGTQDQNVQVKNNIFATYSNGAMATTALELTAAMPADRFTSNNNLFYMPTLSTGNYMKYAGTSFTLAGWRTATGNDVGSLYGDPKFAGTPVVDPFTPGKPAGLNDNVAEATSLMNALPLAAGSPAIDKGANLGASLYDDFLRKVRSSDGEHDGTAIADIGAFEYGAAPVSRGRNPHAGRRSDVRYRIHGGKATFSFKRAARTEAWLTICDPFGKRVAFVTRDEPKSDDGSVSWDYSRSAKGLYCYQLIMKNKVYSGKFIVER